jgi:phosphomevalonate kinase
VRLTVPGNILLLGEYAVLEEGGIGLAAAVDLRVSLNLERSDALEIRGTWPGGSFRWTDDTRDESALVNAVVDTLAAAGVLPEKPGERPQVRIDIDSSALFGPAGRKTGLGSSAAVTAGLTAALVAVSGAQPDATTAQLAVRAHRAAQGGRGSGYDVLASWHGGAGIFRGGGTPHWEPCAFGDDLRLLIFPGPGPVQTAAAVLKYAAWKKGNPPDARAFLEESNARVLAFLSSTSPADASSRWAACRELGIELGRTIRVPADIIPPRGLDPDWSKALGAGNELGACLQSSAGPVPDTEGPVTILDFSREGLRWEE